MRVVDDASFEPQGSGGVASLRPFGDSAYDAAHASASVMRALNDSNFHPSATRAVASAPGSAATSEAAPGSSIDWFRVGVLSGLLVLTLGTLVVLARRPRRAAPAI